MELASRCLCWISCTQEDQSCDHVIRQGTCSLILAIMGNAHIKVVPSMLQDELGGFWFVLTVVHIHLEFIRLDKQRQMVKDCEKPIVYTLIQHVKHSLQCESHIPMWQNNVQHLLVAAHIFPTLSRRYCREKDGKSGSGSKSSGSTL